MALGSLSIMFIVLGLAILVSQFFLYQHNTVKLNFIFIINVFLSVLISWINFSALPINYTNQRFLSLVWGILGGIALVLIISNSKHTLSKLLLTIALFGGFLQLIFI